MGQRPALLCCDSVRAAWRPSEAILPGFHRLELVGDGRVVDRAQFPVR
ncbi:hypothetical protein [Parapedomonas caeni]|jgi:hypothetical protein